MCTSEAQDESLHFHELVHVIQWQHLGEDRFLLLPAKEAPIVVVMRRKPSRRYPTLHLWYASYLEHGYTFRFRLCELPEFLDETVDWATYDSLGQLIVARNGVVTIYALQATHKLTKRFEFNFESLVPTNPE